MDTLRKGSTHIIPIRPLPAKKSGRGKPKTKKRSGLWEMIKKSVTPERFVQASVDDFYGGMGGWLLRKIGEIVGGFIMGAISAVLGFNYAYNFSQNHDPPPVQIQVNIYVTPFCRETSTGGVNRKSIPPDTVEFDKGLNAGLIIPDLMNDFSVSTSATEERGVNNHENTHDKQKAAGKTNCPNDTYAPAGE